MGNIWSSHINYLHLENRMRLAAAFRIRRRRVWYTVRDCWSSYGPTLVRGLIRGLTFALKVIVLVFCLLDVWLLLLLVGD